MAGWGKTVIDYDDREYSEYSRRLEEQLIRNRVYDILYDPKSMADLARQLTAAQTKNDNQKSFQDEKKTRDVSRGASLQPETSKARAKRRIWLAGKVK